MAADPYRSYGFRLEIDGVTEGLFTECSGFNVNGESIPYREGNAHQIVRKIQGATEFAAVTLRFGFTNSKELWDWMMKSVEGNIERKNVSIILMDSEGTGEAMRWNLNDAWPSEWQGAALHTPDQAIAVESLTLVFDSLERARK